MRTTLDIDAPVMKDLKKIQRKEGKSLGRIVSDLLAQAIGERKKARGPIRPPKWISRPMGARVDLADKDAVYAAMESEPPLDDDAGSR